MQILSDQALVISIKFKSGWVSEERGTEADVNALFKQDDNRLIDYAMGLVIGSTEFFLAHHEDDDRFDDYDADVWAE